MAQGSIAAIMVDETSSDDIAPGATEAIHTAVFFDTPLWEALMAWCAFHGLDVAQMPAGCSIIRNATKCSITYYRWVDDDEIARHPELVKDALLIRRCEHQIMTTYQFVEQGEAPPLPFPTAPDPISGAK